MPSSITIPANTAVGTVIYTSDTATTSMTPASDDTGDFTFTTFYKGFSAVLSSYGNDVYDTGIEGIGFRVKGVFRTNQPKTISLYYPNSSDTVSLTGSTTATTQEATFQLVVTSNPVSSGTIDLTTLVAVMHFNDTDWPVFFSGTTDITATACEVNTYDTSVNLGTSYTQRFAGTGSTSSPTEFSINLICSSTSLTPSITFSGTADSNVSSVFANDSGTATGVGIQLLYGSTAITPDTTLSLGKPASTLATDYDFKAQLYQTTSAVTAGSVDTTVNFTLEYE